MKMNHGDLNNQRERLLALTTARLPADGGHWFDEARDAVRGADGREQLALYSAMTRRRLGSEELGAGAQLATRNGLLDLKSWSVADSARLVLLLDCIESSPVQVESIIDDYYRMGDEAEKIALIRGLTLFAPAEFLTAIALDAGRSNSLELLAALTLDNPYPAMFYSDQEFNQMVLKGLFLGFAIVRVYGLSQRANADLARMCENYITERENAGRSVPTDIWLAIGSCASDFGLDKMIEYTAHPESGHRYRCIQTLNHYLDRDERLIPLMRERLSFEQEPLVSKLLQEILRIADNRDEPGYYRPN